MRGMYKTRYYCSYNQLLQLSTRLPRQEFIAHRDFRRLIYERGLRAQPFTGQSELASVTALPLATICADTQTGGRERSVSPEFLRNNEDARRRLANFMRCDLGVLLAVSSIVRLAIFSRLRLVVAAGQQKARVGHGAHRAQVGIASSTGRRKWTASLVA